MLAIYGRLKILIAVILCAFKGHYNNFMHYDLTGFSKWKGWNITKPIECIPSASAYSHRGIIFFWHVCQMHNANYDSSVCR